MGIRVEELKEDRFSRKTKSGDERDLSNLTFSR
jgi:hypothetical protein